MRRLLALLVAAGLSLLIGLAASEIASLVPCRGEGLVCNLDQAIGAYAVIIWSLLGPLVFGVILLVTGNRVTLGGRHSSTSGAARALRARQPDRELDEDSASSLTAICATY